MIRILILSADPIDGDRLRVQDEFYEIRRRLLSVLREDEINLQISGAMSLKNLQEDFLQHTPDIVHFSGHGSKSGRIVFKNAITGKGEAASIQDLATLFELDKDRIRCVLLNACYTEEQATAIALHIDCTIGIANEISDQTAIIFSTIFYVTLAKGRSVREAFSRGLLQLEYEQRPAADTIKMKPREGIDCSKIIPIRNLKDSISDQGINNFVGQMFKDKSTSIAGPSHPDLLSLLKDVPMRISLREFWEVDEKGNLSKRILDLLYKGDLTDYEQEDLEIILARVPIRLSKLQRLTTGKNNVELEEEVLSMYHMAIEIIKTHDK
jgi:hypothetical protein